MHNFRDLIVWQKARFLVKDIYNLVSNFPIDEKFGLTSQIKRAVISISSNIAEGAGRDSDKDFIRFLDMANGSTFELETQLYLAFDLNFINKTDLEIILGQVIEIEKLIYGFRNKLKQS